jgi:hypothetical protein
MKRTELVLVSITLSFFMLYLLGVAGISVFVVLFLSLIGALFGYFGFAHLNGVRLADAFKKDTYKHVGTLNIVMAIVSGLGMGALINGILFRIMFWDGSDQLLMIGLMWTLLCGVSIWFLRAISPILKKRVWMRSLILLSLGILFLVLPAHTWFAVRYRNFPEYVEAMKDYRYTPTESTFAALEDARKGLVK